MDEQISLNILDLIPLGVIVLDKEGKVMIINEEALQLFWEESGSPVGLSSIKLKGDPLLMEALNSGMPTPGYELIINSNTYRVISHKLKRGKNAGALIFISQNITQIKQYFDKKLDKLVIIEQRIQKILDCCYDGIHVIDENLISLMVNKAWVNTTGLPPSNVLGQTVEATRGYMLNPHSASKVALDTKKQYTMIMTTEVGQKLKARATPILNVNNDVEMIVCNVAPLSYLEALENNLLVIDPLADNNDAKRETLKKDFMRQENAVVESSIMLQTVDTAIKVAPHPSTVLLLGESGTGKELLAKLIHKCSPRSKNPFIIVNCGAIPEALIESELFGYEKGAFTGASYQGKQGLFEISSGGTLFLDEVAELPLPLQAKFLRVLENKTITRVGGTSSKEVDVRIIAATNKDLSNMVSQGQFRDDLYYRLKVIEILVPPLRERKEDIIPLAAVFLRKFNADYNKLKRFSMEVLDLFIRYSWTGNVRELRNVIERLVLTTSGQDILPCHLPAEILSELEPSVNNNYMNTEIDPSVSLKVMIQNYEKRMINEALRVYKNADEAAKALGIDRSTLFRKLKK